MQIFNMGDNPNRQQLPLVELRPFSKKVWRREKSLPDFYEKPQDDLNKVATKEKKSEVTSVTAQMLKEIESSRKPMESRQGPTVDYQLGKVRCHPKAEFSHESRKSWRTQDILPSFITRLERTRTTLESFSRESEFKLPLENFSQDQEEHAQMFPTNMVVRGGRMQQRIYRRHMLYLNPLHSYRHPESLPSAFNGTNFSSLTNSREKGMATRHSFPLSSSRATELLLNGSTHNNYPLRPIRHEHAPSPHRFNNKLGAAKNSLHVLSQWGVPTKLEKNLEKEFEMNLDRFRRDRILLPFDLRNAQSQYANFNTTLTRGEANLKEAREANKARKKAVTSNAVQKKDNRNSPGDENCETHRDNSAEIDSVMHPISRVLPEESESCAMQGSDVEEMVDNRQQPPRTTDLNDYEGKENQLLSRNKQLQFASDIPPASTLDFETGDMNPKTGRDSKRRVTMAGRSLSSENLTSCLSPSSQPERTKPGLGEQINREKDTNSGSHTARARTNLEYLHNLRTKGALPPLQSREQVAILSENASHQLISSSQHEVPPDVGSLGYDGKLTESASSPHLNVNNSEATEARGSDKVPQSEMRESAEPPSSVNSRTLLSNVGASDSNSQNKHYPVGITYHKAGKSAAAASDNAIESKVCDKSIEVKTANEISEYGIHSIDQVTCATSAISKPNNPQENVAQLNNADTCVSFKDKLENNGNLNNSDAPINGTQTNDRLENQEKVPSVWEKKPKDPDSFGKASMDTLGDIVLTEEVDRAYEMDFESPEEENSSKTANNQNRDTNDSSIRQSVVGEENKTNPLQKASNSIVYQVITTEEEPLSFTTPLPTLDASVSDNEGMLSCSADNGDSGVSTTFLTASDAASAQLV